jgi:DNA-binding NarL/FixJ family response regulator
MLKIVIFDDHRERREAIRLLISLQDGMECTGDFEDCTDLVNNLSADPPNVVLMDVNMPGVTGIVGVKLLQQYFPETFIIMQTVFEDDENLFNCLVAGADGYLLKKASNVKLIDALLDVVQGVASMTPEIAKRALTFLGKTKQATAEDSSALSKDQEILLTQIADGFSLKQIAMDFSTSEAEVQDSIKNIYYKLHSSKQIAHK